MAYGILVLLCSLLPQQAPPALPQENPGMKVLIERLGSQEPSDREDAYRAIVERPLHWSAPELDLLRKAGDARDKETAARARDALARIRFLKAWMIQLRVDLSADGSLRVDDEPAKDPAAAFARFSASPSGTSRLRLLIRIDPSTPFSHVYRTLKSAVEHAPVHEVLLEPHGKTPAKEVVTERVLLLSSHPRDGKRVPMDWKEKFIKEINYHYFTQQIRNRRIEELSREVESLKKKLKETGK